MNSLKVSRNLSKRSASMQVSSELTKGIESVLNFINEYPHHLLCLLLFHFCVLNSTCYHIF